MKPRENKLLGVVIPFLLPFEHQEENSKVEMESICTLWMELCLNKTVGGRGWESREGDYPFACNMKIPLESCKAHSQDKVCPGDHKRKQ